MGRSRDDVACTCRRLAHSIRQPATPGGIHALASLLEQNGWMMDETKKGTLEVTWPGLAISIPLIVPLTYAQKSWEP